MILLGLDLVLVLVLVSLREAGPLFAACSRRSGRASSRCASPRLASPRRSAPPPTTKTHVEADAPPARLPRRRTPFCGIVICSGRNLAHLSLFLSASLARWLGLACSLARALAGIQNPVGSPGTTRAFARARALGQAAPAPALAPAAQRRRALKKSRFPRRESGQHGNTGEAGSTATQARRSGRHTGRRAGEHPRTHTHAGTHEHGFATSVGPRRRRPSHGRRRLHRRRLHRAQPATQTKAPPRTGAGLKLASGTRQGRKPAPHPIRLPTSTLMSTSTSIPIRTSSRCHSDHIRTSFRDPDRT